MKKIVLVLFILGFIFSCEKEKETGDISFSTRFARVSDSVLYDSVSHIVVNYSLVSEEDNSSMNDSTKYSHSILFDVDKSEKKNGGFGTKYIHLDEGRYVIKKFDLINQSGEVIYCIPYEVPEDYKSNVINTVTTLPIIFRTPEATNAGFSFTIIKR